MDGWCVFVCSYAHMSNVCVLDVYLIIIQCYRAVNGGGILNLGSSFEEFCSDSSTCQVLCCLPSLFTIIATQCYVSSKLPCPCTCTNISL